jgi:predicted HicB family RNase H-like nuclease
MATLLYKGFTATLEIIPDGDIILGRLEGIPDTITFAAKTPAQVPIQFGHAVDEYLESCKKIGRVPARPYSGKIQLRVSPSLHAAIAHVVKLEGLGSIQNLGKALLQKAAEKHFPKLGDAYEAT